MLQLKDLTKVFGEGDEQYLAVDNINLEVKQGEFVVLIGPSGCGKTTTLKMINYLVQPTSGDVIINGKYTKDVNPVKLRRDIGYVIQSIGLFPHLTIAANVEVVPKLKKWPKSKKHKRTLELLELVGLDPDIYANRYPSELSGGEQQRIGVLRALAAEPDLILMDEPFGALDPITRDQLQEEIKDLQERLKKTIVFVTHDMDEALKLADKIVIMRDGKIIQEDTPKRILAKPANEFVREFIGEDRLAPQPDITPVSDVMVADPLIISAKTSPKEVLELMKKRKTDHAIIKDENDKVKGLITANRIQTHKGKVNEIEDLIEENAVTVRGKATIRDAAATLVNGTRVLIVVDSQNRPRGLISRTTLLQALVEIWDDNNTA